MATALSVATAADMVYIRINGEGVARICPTLRAFMARMAKAGKQAFIVDLAACHYVDSSFMGTLLEAVTELNKRVVIINASKSVADRFELLGLNQFMPIKQGSINIPYNLSLHRLPIGAVSQRALTEAVERAHLQLVKADQRNRARFEPLLKLLRKELEQE